MEDRPDDQASELFDGVETAKGNKTSGQGLEVTPEKRPRGILSPTDRDYLCGLKDYEQPQTDANRRQDIRERVRNGLKDFTLLSLFMRADEREKIYDELGEEEIEDALVSMIAFAYLGLGKDRPRFKSVVEKGVLQAENLDKLFKSAGRATDVNVSISVEYNPDGDKLYQQLQNGRDLTDAEIGHLVREGRLDSDDLDQLEDSTWKLPIVSSGADSEPKD